MSQQTLWDFLDEGGGKQQYLESAEKEDARRRAVKRLRAGGHWLTLLRVARAIPQPFTLNDISVAVWRACPEFFGMKGYPYPDNHKVHYILYGSRGLIARGAIRRVREGLFCVAEGTDVEAVLAGTGEKGTDQESANGRAAVAIDLGVPFASSSPGPDLGATDRPPKTRPVSPAANTVARPSSSQPP